MAELSTPENLEEWKAIRNKLCDIFKICNCQRKIKSIITSLAEIKEKCLKNDYSFTGAEWLLIAIIDSYLGAITHGTNIEYPIINKEHSLWIWIEEVKNNPNLIDN